MLNQVIFTKRKRSYVNVLVCICGFVLKLLFYLEKSHIVSKVPEVVGARIQPQISYSEAKSLTTTSSKIHLKVVKISYSWCKRSTYTKNSGKTHIRCDPYTQLNVAHSGPTCSNSWHPCLLPLWYYYNCSQRGIHVILCMTCIIIDIRELSKVNFIAWTLRKQLYCHK